MVSKQNDGMHSFYRNYFDQQRELLQNGKVITESPQPPRASFIHTQAARSQLLPRGAHGTMSCKHFSNPHPPRNVVGSEEVSPKRNPETMPNIPRVPAIRKSPRTPRGLKWGRFDPTFEWNGRHHVSTSKDNANLFTAYRNFFDRPTVFGNGKSLSPRQSRVLLDKHQAMDSRFGLEPVGWSGDARPNTVR